MGNKVKKITVAITVRGNDSRLLKTIESVKERVKGMDAEIMVVSDGACSNNNLPNDINLVLTDTKPRGTSFAKHTAMINAGNDIVVCCDSHMEFPAGCFEMYHDHLTAFPKHIVCSQTNMIGPDRVTSVYYGGMFKCKVIGDPRKPHIDNKVDRQPFAVSWRDVRYSGPLQGVMGGCYGLTKSFYDTMEQPWQYGKGWGADEESISLAAWYMGGMGWLLPQTIDHYGGTRGFVEDNYFKSAPLYNRKRVVEMIDDKVTREEFIRWFDQAHSFVIADLKDFSQITTWRKSITEKKKRYFVDLIDDWESNITVKELYQVQKERGVEVKKNQRKAKMVDMWKNPKGEGVVAKKEEKKVDVPARANYGAMENRRVCHKCGSYGSKVNNTKKTGRTVIRYRECLDCHALRCTQEIVK
jgi:glycosyltransferase involved in cell wall biosynthesis